MLLRLKELETNQHIQMAHGSKASTPAPVHKGNKRKWPATKKATQDNVQLMDVEVEAPSAMQLLSQSLQTTDDWFKSVRTKKGYANYVKNGKKLLAEWTMDGSTDEDEVGLVGVESDREELGKAFDEITEHTQTALRLVMAYKCKHLGRAFVTAEGLRSAFKHYFEWGVPLFETSCPPLISLSCLSVHRCQGEFWKYNSHTSKWEGNPVFESDFKAYFESLKNHDNRTGTSMQALPMLPKDLKTIIDFLDSLDAVQHIGLMKQRCISRLSPRLHSRC
jgi:hypothetical protein